MLRALAGIITTVLLTTACGPMGSMDVRQDPRYLAVHSGNSTNYYRIRVEGNTRLGKAEFRSGWYPAEAVDSLFGDVSTEGAVGALKTRQDIKAAISRHYVAVIEAYLTAAKNPNTTEDELRKLLIAQRRVLAVPGDGTALPAGSIQMEFDPRRDLILRHSDDKLVFVLSSDPDEVIGAIVNFAEHQQTSVQVTRLAEVLSQQAVNRVAASEAEIAALKSTDALLARRINQVKDVASNEQARKTDVIQELEALLIMVDGLR